MSCFNTDLKTAMGNWKKGPLLVGGNFNCKIGYDVRNEYLKVRGAFCDNVSTSINGEKLLDFALSHDLVITHSLFHGYQTKVDRKKTWPDKSALSEPEVANKFQEAVEKSAAEQSITSVEDLHKVITKAELILPRTNIPSKAAKPAVSPRRSPSTRILGLVRWIY
ncbi:hypothetical protein Ciccas_012786 [Cichlidogyrus casuarinus]|uniref:Uncharacterized protein n=1 Tax=Cichlidogyrus casuarinus TaxID=1844966 RepID=A0ABD2PMB9_9PLAT